MRRANVIRVENSESARAFQGVRKEIPSFDRNGAMVHLVLCAFLCISWGTATFKSKLAGEIKPPKLIFTVLNGLGLAKKEKLTTN